MKPIVHWFNYITHYFTGEIEEKEKLNEEEEKLDEEDEKEKKENKKVDVADVIEACCDGEEYHMMIIW